MQPVRAALSGGLFYRFGPITAPLREDQTLPSGPPRGMDSAYMVQW